MERKAMEQEMLARRAEPGRHVLDHAIMAAELYMKSYAAATNPSHRALLRRKCAEMVALAEVHKLREAKNSLLPLHVRQISSQEKAILHESSRLNGNYFPLWDSDPLEGTFLPLPGGMHFSDPATYTMSRHQSDILNSWKRPALFCHSESAANDPSEKLMALRGPCDLVQDITTDCSVVASLCAAMNILVAGANKKPLLASLMFPFDHENRRPKVSQNGTYIFRMHFNGCFRKVVVDDRLPTSKEHVNRCLHVVDRRNPDLLWPALMEKAYLKVRGGYDFPGSNSGTDLWVMTGWIPEQLFLQSEDIDLNQAWGRMVRGCASSTVILTLGTGRLSPSEEEALGLVGEHDYAVLDLSQSNGIRRLLVKNPWCDGLIWNGDGFRDADQRTARRPPVGSNFEETNGPHLPGTFWMSLEEVAQNFESMYLNWDPTCFGHRQDHHFTWQVPQKTMRNTLAYNPQYSMRSTVSEVAWILLSRHFADQELQITRNARSGSLAATAKRVGYTGISIFENDGKRVQATEVASYRGPYVDSPQTLAKFAVDAGKAYTVIMTHEDLPLDRYSCTFSFFSQEPLEVEPAREDLQHFKEVTGSWSRRSAGGNASSPTYSQNPQFRISIPTATPLSILLSTANRDLAIHLDLVWSPGKRVISIGKKDVVASSGDYRCGSAFMHVPEVEAGTYVIVCSTFESGQFADFAMRVGSMVECKMSAVAGDGAGLFCSRVPVLSFAAGEERKQARITTTRLTRAYVVARSSNQPGQIGLRPSGAGIRISLVYGRGPHAEILATSGCGDFRELVTALQTPEFDIEPDRLRCDPLWLVVERLGSHRPMGRIEIEFLGDNSVQCGLWEDIAC
ncbi:calpain-7 [Sodiomyces alkalinus F11]|uniref:Calpain-7 n=1 Tax=Sodiomyces alkalinus (strain CBS 110278 / VKM F-3762 / F11) TaxID=1314773 RepID=A0A3N2PWH2_SODAK|nr:calpain-7 [Sodiomyces alkalinus F11]ROT38860.1 calpain-7 [Sodiomyces alkalinus F11]